ncbi:MAG: GDSL family lipase [Oscillospiraceae bacterium]|nr:GDSL family lipase [Oscillospiraceae bacterium]
MGKMICIGDSLTYGYGVRRSQCWTELAAEMSGWTLVNCGVCGDTTGGMLARMRETLREETGSRDERCFLLMGGCNDIFFSGSSTGARENMAAMAHQLFAEGEMPLIAVGPGIAKGAYPSMWSDLVDFPEAAEEIARYYEWLERFCSSFGVRMIDFRRDFRDRAGMPRTEYYLDGLHLNPEGHRVMAERVAKVLAVMDRETMNP